MSEWNEAIQKMQTASSPKARERIEAIADILKQRDEALFTGDAYEADDDEREDTAEVILAALSATEGEAEPVAWQQFKGGKWVECSHFVAFGWGNTIADGCRALYAHPPSAPAGVKVKPLEWKEYETEGEIDRWDTETALGTFYEIITEFDGYHVAHDYTHWAVKFETPDEAKAAAQADYESRIVSALEVPR